MKHLHIDIETYSEVDLRDTGVYPYAAHSSFQILLLAYRWDDGPEIVLDLHADDTPGDSVPDDVWYALCDPAVLKIAHNANFEMVCIASAFNLPINPAQWFCTMVGAAYLGLPLTLDKVSQVLGLTEQKDAKGKALITYFCKPCKPTKKNGGRLRNMPSDDPEKWEDFKEYNAQDVRVECAILNYLDKFPPILPAERLYWVQDQDINARGISIDLDFVHAAIKTNNEFLEFVHSEIIRLTGISNPNSPAQLKTWIERQTGEPLRSIGKEFLAEAINEDLLPDNVVQVLRLRQLGSRTSVSKYTAMLNYLCADGRIRGLVQFYGANRTGRFSGRGVQVQNLKKTLGKGLETAKLAVIKGVADLLYDDVPDVVSKLVRTALVAKPRHSLVVSDFAAIEGRVLAWLAGEDWVLEVFRTHGKLYEATYANMFNVPIESVVKGSDMRAKGKIAALALGYQGAVGALITMGALREGLREEELPGIVKRWRIANPKIVKFWRECEQAVKHVIINRSSIALRKPYCSIGFSYERRYLFITLPSGRRLSYYGAEVRNNKLTYWGMDQVKKIWIRIDTYGGSIVENITQAVARDCLTDSMLRMDGKVNILMHIHDEIVAEEPDEIAQNQLKVMEQIMSVSPLWASDLPLEGDGYVSKFYKKD